jgi:ABC-2 type transport system ATP-binding protein
MIKIDSITKYYGDFKALDKVSFEIPTGTVYGLVGINGAGKSTLLRIMSGIYNPNGGSVTYDGQAVFDNPSVKGRIAFVPDDLYLPPNMSIEDMAKRYENLYGRPLNRNKLSELAANLGLNTKQRFSTFSKGMRRQASTILALSLEAEYVFFDETFDGLDPFKRGYIKRLLKNEVKERGITVIISSHSLKELEDVCDSLAVLDKGGLVIESEIGDIESVGTKIQIAFREPFDRDSFKDLDIISFTKLGSVAQMIVRGNRESICKDLRSRDPLLMEILPLTLEEAFTYRLESHGVNTLSEGATGGGKNEK